MYEDSGCFDPDSVPEAANAHAQLPFMAGHSSSISPPNRFEDNLNFSADELSLFYQVQQLLPFGANDNSVQDSTFPEETSYSSPLTAELLNLVHLSGCSASTSFISPTSTINTSLGLLGDLPMADTASSSASLYDQLFSLNLPQQPPFFRKLFQSLPSHSFGGGGGGSLLLGAGEDDHREENGGQGGFCPDGVGGPQLFGHGVLKFGTNICSVSEGKGAGKDKGTKHYVSESQRRKHMTDKYEALRSLVPNPTKNDKASVVRDAIEYIKALLRTVDDLKLLVEKKRCGGQRMKRLRTEVGEPHLSYSASLRSSWLQRKSKDTEVDVRIVEDEVNIKLVQRKKMNCMLLYVSKVLDELQLDLHHVAGGRIGDHCSFFFNAKMHEGSQIYGSSAIANKLVEVVDRELHLQVATSKNESFIGRSP